MSGDPDPTGPDGYVKLRGYESLSAAHCFGVTCAGPGECSHAALLDVPAAIRLMGTGEATVGDLRRRLRCGKCGGRRISVVVRSDPRPAWARKPERPMLVSTAGHSSGPR